MARIANEQWRSWRKKKKENTEETARAAWEVLVG
jgi:hypothetical protein